MAVRLVCRACGKRLKLPDGLTAERSAKCPKCLAPVDLTAALEASAYVPTVASGLTAVPNADVSRKPAFSGADDPLPHSTTVVTVTKPTSLPKTAPPKPNDTPRLTPLLGADDPLPYSPAKPTALSVGSLPSVGSGPPPLPPATAPNADGVLSLDDDPSDGPPPADPAPFRVPVRVLADSLTSTVGPCSAVLLPHGLFLEHEPMKPFLYVPPGGRVDSPAPGELTVALPDGRSMTVRFQGGSARPLARDTRAFLAGDRPVPVAADYRFKWWMLAAAMIFALGPLVLSQTVVMGLEFGPQVGAGLALAGFLVNAAVATFSRRSAPVQVFVMAGGCALVTGAFLSVATAYLAGRQEGAEQAKTEPPPSIPPSVPQAPLPPPPPEPKPEPEPRPAAPPSHIDRAKKNGASALEDGPADVTALTLSSDGKTLSTGYADGAVKLWDLTQPTFDAELSNLRADGPVTRVQFDTTGRFVFAHTATGAIAAPRGVSSESPAKLPGAPVAIASELDGERVRFAAVRGNLVAHRLINTTFIQTPPKVMKGYALPGKGDEIVPMSNAKDPAKPNGPTFLAWMPGGRLYAGQPDGTINIWSNTMRAEAPSRDHKASVKAWAECPATGDFATGDDEGRVGVWSAKGGKPTVSRAFSTSITGLSFSPSGTRLAITDNTGWLVIWDPAEGKALHRVKRPTAVRAMAFGPDENVIVIAAGRTAEVWWVPELVK